MGDRPALTELLRILALAGLFALSPCGFAAAQVGGSTTADIAALSQAEGKRLILRA